MFLVENEATFHTVYQKVHTHGDKDLSIGGEESKGGID
jgi:hypothetical protein